MTTPEYQAGYADGHAAAGALVEAVIDRVTGFNLKRVEEPTAVELADAIYTKLEAAGFQLTAWRAGGPGVTAPNLLM